MANASRMHGKIPDTIVNVTMATKKLRTVNAKTLMNAKMASVPTGFAGTNRVLLNAIVRPDFICRATENNARITTNANKPECVPTVSAPTWTVLSSANAIRAISFPYPV